MFNILPVWQVRTRMASLCVCLGLVTLSHAYVNVALNKPAHQQKALLEGNDLYDASNAVDGLKSNLRYDGGQCTVSADGQETATWWVNLTSIHSIHHIIIYYRTDNVEWQPSNGFRARFLGFSVYVSNTTNRLQGIECFKDKNFTLDTILAVFTTTCPVHGQYVIYYNERLSNVTYPSYYDKNAHNELCEVEVYGCAATGFYGVNCSAPCPDVNCQYCHVETGTCQGCKPGYQGHRCEMDCPAGYYGKECSMLCSETCKGCNNVNGSCDKGCHPGWRGDDCEIECSSSMFGDGCLSQCGQCAVNLQCHHINGTCLHGCEPGYTSQICNQTCPDGYFGQDCAKKCSVTCAGCNNVNGLCDSGCLPGWKGYGCQQPCEFSYYGLGCNQECSSFCSRSRECHHVSGHCKDGCKSGWEGLDCLEVSKLTVTENKLASEFIGILSAFCILLFLIGVVITYFVVKRFRNSKVKQPAIYQSNIAQKGCESEVSNVHINENNGSEYQELGEISKPETYDTLQDEAYNQIL